MKRKTKMAVGVGGGRGHPSTAEMTLSSKTSTEFHCFFFLIFGIFWVPFFGGFELVETGFYWVFLGCYLVSTGLQRLVLGCTGFYLK